MACLTASDVGASAGTPVSGMADNDMASSLVQQLFKMGEQYVGKDLAWNRE